MRIDTIFANAKAAGRPVFSFEIFPPKGDLTFEQASALVSDLAPLGPDFVSVTFSAGGSGSHGRAADATASVAQILQDDHNVPALAHLTCVNTNKAKVDAICEDLKARGIQNVLALRGDIPEGGQVTDFPLAIDLISYLKDKGFCVGAAAYPEGHVDVLDPKMNIEHLKAKQDAGADFFVTQLCFDNNLLYRFKDDALSAGIDTPINFGIMPFFSKSQIERMVFMCGVSLPGAIIKLLNRYEDDEKALYQAGIEYAAGQLADLAKQGMDGLHLYTMNKPEVARMIRNRVVPVIAEQVTA